MPAKMPAERARDFIERCGEEGLVLGTARFAEELGREFARAEMQGSENQVPKPPRRPQKQGGRPKGAPNDRPRPRGKVA